MTDWRKQRDRKEIRTSPTQHETFELCPRKWWLSRVRKLPDGGSTHAQAFGTVLHSVCERYLLADDLGIDPETGEAVDLYPEGWHIAHNRYGGIDGEVDQSEQDIIKLLISKAIEEGVLQRKPGRRVEHNFRVPIVEIDDTKVSLEGLIDYDLPGEAQDHKTTKSTRWLKSKNALAESFQMLAYGYVKWVSERFEKVTLRHNGYVKDFDNPVVRKTEVTVYADTLKDFWENRVVANAVKMYEMRLTVERWSEAQGPESMARACTAYGGCPYRLICTGRETEEMYEKRVSGHVDKSSNEVYAVTVEGHEQRRSPEMASLAERLAQKKAANAGTSPAPAVDINPPKEEEPAPAQAEETPKAEAPTMPEGIVLPPWVDPDDLPKPNNGLGFDTKGQPCKIAAIMAKQKKLPTPDLFDIITAGEGTVAWVGKEGTDAEGLEGLSMFKEIGDVEVQERVATEPEPSPKEEPKTEPVRQSDPDDDEGDIEDIDINIKAGTPGRPKMGFVLCINGTPGTHSVGRDPRRKYNLAKILQQVQDEMAAESGDASYYHIDVFRRRDALAAAAPKIAEQFGTGIVWCVGYGTGQSDMKTLVDALIPLAGDVIIFGGH